MILKSPNKAFRIPDAMTTRHIGKPRLCTLVATLLRFPRVIKPRAIMDKPRATRPASLLNAGHIRAYHFLKKPNSEMMRKTPMTLEMK